MARNRVEELNRLAWDATALDDSGRDALAALVARFGMLTLVVALASSMLLRAAPLQLDFAGPGGGITLWMLGIALACSWHAWRRCVPREGEAESA